VPIRRCSRLVSIAKLSFSLPASRLFALYKRLAKARICVMMHPVSPSIKRASGGSALASPPWKLPSSVAMKGLDFQGDSSKGRQPE